MKKQTTRDKLLDITFDEVYINGYAATSVDAILKRAGVPKGSMYHHFKSKKELVLAMVEERLFPKMDIFFVYEQIDGRSVYDSFRAMLIGISKNKMLITYGCPLYRLMVELAATDSTFDILLTSKAVHMREGIESLLQRGVEIGEFDSSLDTSTFANFMLSSVWGMLSLSPTLSSPKSFISQSRYILEALDSYVN